LPPQAVRAIGRERQTRGPVNVQGIEENDSASITMVGDLRPVGCGERLEHGAHSVRLAGPALPHLEDDEIVAAIEIERLRIRLLGHASSQDDAVLATRAEGYLAVDTGFDVENLHDAQNPSELISDTTLMGIVRMSSRIARWAAFWRRIKASLGLLAR